MEGVYRTMGGHVMGRAPGRNRGTESTAGDGRGGTVEAGIFMLVEGMACSACARRVAEALRRISGVRRVEVDLEAAGAAVWFDQERVVMGELTGAVEAAGDEACGFAARPLGAAIRTL